MTIQIHCGLDSVRDNIIPKYIQLHNNLFDPILTFTSGSIALLLRFELTKPSLLLKLIEAVVVLRRGVLDNEIYMPAKA